MDFKKLQDTATTSKEALANKTSETAKALEKSFVDAMTSWETAVKATEDEAKTDTTKSPEALQVRSDFDTFKNDLKKEIADLLTQEKAENNEVEQQTKAEKEQLSGDITKDSISIISAAKDLYKDKTRADMIQMDNLPTYIDAFQTIIIQLGASTGLDDTSIDRIGPITRAGIKTIQQYLNDTYQVGLDIDGVPGPKTLEALFTLIGGEGADKDMTRLDKMLSEKPTLSPFPVEVIPTITKTNVKDKIVGGPPIETTPVEIKNNIISKIVIDIKFLELKKLCPTFDIAFLKAWAMGILNLKEPATTGEFIYNNKIYYFDNSKPIGVSGSKVKFEKRKKNKTKAAMTKVDENIGENTTVDNNIISVNQERIESGLDIYMKKKENRISFQEGPSKTLYEDYYEKNIINLKNVKIITSLLRDGKTKINFTEHGKTRYSIDLEAKDFIKKEKNNINYETINTAIKNDIISKVDKEIEKKEIIKLEKRYGELKKHLEEKRFTMELFYTKEEQKNTFIQAFFKDFPNGVEFKKYRSTFDKLNKKIKFEFDYKEGNDDKEGNNKYRYGIIDINNKFEEDGQLNKTAINKGIKSIIEIIIKRTYPKYTTVPQGPDYDSA